jgi:hypothetical protein
MAVEFSAVTCVVQRRFGPGIGVAIRGEGRGLAGGDIVSTDVRAADASLSSSCDCRRVAGRVVGRSCLPGSQA